MKFSSVRTRLVAVATAAVGVAALATGCGAQADASGDGTTIRYQTSPGLINIAEMADALGYLPGISLDNVGVVQGGPQAMQALATGQVDLAGSFVGAVANVVSNGTPIKAVIAYYGSNKDVYDEVLVKEGSPITKPQDLIGKKVAVNTLGAQAEALLDLWFTKAGMTADQINQVTLVPLPSINAEAALRNGQVDAALLNGSLLVKAVEGGGLTPIMKDTDVFGSYNGGSYEMADSWLSAHPDVAKEFVGGMAKAIQYIDTHSKDEVLGIYDKWLTENGQQDNVAALSSWVSTGIASKGGVLSDADYTKWTDWLKQKSLIKSDLDPGSLYTNEFNPYANGQGDPSPEPSTSPSE